MEAPRARGDRTLVLALVLYHLRARDFPASTARKTAAASRIPKSHANPFYSAGGGVRRLVERAQK